MPIWKIIIIIILGLDPKNPWLINSGFINAIAVESPFMMKYYTKNSLPKEKLILSGTFNDDKFYDIIHNYDKYKKKLSQELNLDSKPIILCALPPAQEAKLQYNISNYYEMLEDWIKILNKINNYNVIYCLHPNIDYNKVKYLENKGAKFVKQDIRDLIPLCGVYIASVSATIRWAIACGKPVINYDVYKYRYHDYDTAKGVVTVEKKEDFEKVLKKITMNKKYYQELKEKQEKCAKDWGMLDGKSGKRIIDLIENLTKNEKK